MKLSKNQKTTLDFVRNHPGTTVNEVAEQLETTTSGAGLSLASLIKKELIMKDGGKFTVQEPGAKPDTKADSTNSAKCDSVGSFVNAFRSRMAIYKYDDDPEMNRVQAARAKAAVDSTLAEMKKEYGF